MNYYDEEISIGDSEPRNLSNVKMERLPSRNGSSATGAGAVGGRGIVSGKHRILSRDRNALQNNSTDDDGLLQDIIDHDDEDDDDDDDDEDDSDLQHEPPSNKPQLMRRSATSQRPQTRPGSTRTLNLPTAKALDNDTEPSDADSDEGAAPTTTTKAKAASSAGKTGAIPTGYADAALSITSDSWERLSVSEEVKELFPYILKYTPQTVVTHYNLQPFVPEYVPAVGDVDAFLKVTIPALLQPQREQETNEHLRKKGLYFLDEPSGAQSEPSLLNYSLRSVLAGSSGLNARSASASLVPTATSPKDIDKWIAEVEKLRSATSEAHAAQPRVQIEALLADWPRTFAEASSAVQDAYESCIQDRISLTEYINILCRRFDVVGPCETQADHILNVQTLFALYLAANQAWE